jgi:hypothetical protein
MEVWKRHELRTQEETMGRVQRIKKKSGGHYEGNTLPVRGLSLIGGIKNHQPRSRVLIKPNRRSLPASGRYNGTKIVVDSSRWPEAELRSGRAGRIRW